MNKIYVIIILLISATSKIVVAKPFELNNYSIQTINVMNNIKELILPTLTREEKKIVKNIRNESPTTWGVGAFVFKRGNKNIIQIPAGTTWVFNNISVASLVTQLSNKKNCITEYLNHLFSAINDNTISGRQSVLASDLFGYSIGSYGSCKGLDPKDYTPFPHKVRTINARTVERSIMLFYLHEIGHIIKGHLSINKKGISLNKSRSMEEEADIWAISKFLDAKEDATMAMPLFILISTMGGDSNDKESTHPMGLERVIKWNQYILKYMKKNKFNLEDISYQENTTNTFRNLKVKLIEEGL
jgi:hypothetical protein